MMFNENIYKIVLSSPAKGSLEREYTRADIVSNGEMFQASMYTAK